MPNFTSQNILITAGAGGIGYAIAAAFGGAGAGVHVVDVDGAAVAAARAAHPAWLASVADVADEGAVAGVFAAHLQRFGGIDVLVNGAGIAGPTALLEEISAADWRRCLAVNLDAAFLCCRAAIPDMRRRRARRHHQYFIHRWLARLPSARALCGFQMGVVGVD